MVKRLAYFDQWMDSSGVSRAEALDGVEAIRMDQSEDEAKNWEILASSHGYQLRPSTETEQRYWPSRTFIDACPNLLAISSAGSGYDIVDVDACTERGILVCSQSGSNADSVAQHVFGMALVLCKQIIQSDRAIRRESRDWTRWNYRGHELTGRTIGIVGLGNVGTQVAAISKIFNMQAVAYDPYVSDDDFRERGVIREPSLETLFSDSDLVSINCPLTDETRGMVGTELYDKMKPNSIFITTARGFIHDEKALVVALSEGKIGAAGCDVFEEEPPNHSHPLLNFDNVIVSPHNAGVTSDCNENMTTYALQQWTEIFGGHYPSRLRNPTAWPLYCQRFEKMFGVAPTRSE
ncbi:MAG: hypothetical protein CBB68_02720 [Rhodospirillaceae bacterium TMED8]|nr:3-phosphoglycerate dehydrogenase [Magnetovibrio sp.]OUT52288.1 MAG: hypothetical protein CBB68_02720 [Rhodospirillaceae bacterium TMED8]|tara:strand:+ start:405 stop:1454 length:1050 start_codon:yes stop_codon:yes gene_type:complete